MSTRLLQQFLHRQENLLLFTTELGHANSVQLVYKVLSNCSVYIRSTYSLDDYNILVDISAPQRLFEIIDLVQTLLQLSASSWLFNNSIYKLTVQRAVCVHGQEKVKEYAIYIEEGVLHKNNMFKSWNFIFNIFYGAPIDSQVFTPLLLPQNNSAALLVDDNLTSHLSKYSDTCID